MEKLSIMRLNITVLAPSTYRKEEALKITTTLLTATVQLLAKFADFIYL